MPRHVVFLRAINVAGHATVKMRDVLEVFVSAGGRNVRTYSQSGNVVFDAPGSRARAVLLKTRGQLRRLLGEEPEIFHRTVRELDRIVRATPFGDLTGHRELKLYVVFLSRKPAATAALPIASAKERLEIVATHGREAFVVSRRKDNGFYGFPNTFVEQALGVRATSRNWSTVTKLAEFTRGLEAPGASRTLAGRKGGRREKRAPLPPEDEVG